MSSTDRLTERDLELFSELRKDQAVARLVKEVRALWDDRNKTREELDSICLMLKKSEARIDQLIDCLDEETHTLDMQKLVTTILGFQKSAQ